MIGRLARAAGTTILVVSAAALFAMSVMPNFGHRATVLVSGSMAPTVPAGGMILVEEVDPTTIEVGDVITYRGYREEGLVTHRVLSLHDVQGELHFRTQGDANEHPDGDLAPAAGVVGRMRLDLTPVAPLLTWLTGSRARLLVPGLAALWLAASEVRELRQSRRRQTARSGALLPAGAATRSGPALPPPWLSWTPASPPAPPPPVPPARHAAASAPPPPPPPPPVGVEVSSGHRPVQEHARAGPLTWSAARAHTMHQRQAHRRPGRSRIAAVGLATVLAVTSVQASAASFLDGATVTAATVGTAAVAAPTGTSATFDCGQSTVGPHVTVTWDSVGDAEGYEVRRRVGTSGDFAAVGSTTGTTFTDTTVQLDTTYEYVVVATAGSWASEPSTPEEQTTTATSC